MNKIFILLILLFSGSALAQHGTLKNGPIFCSTVPGAECIEENRFSGVYKDIKFSLFDDGSGTVQGYKHSGGEDHMLDWSMGCEKDVISGKKSCYVHKRKGQLWIWIYPGNRIRVFVGRDHYPGTRTSIRINQNVYHTTADEAFPNSAAIVSKMQDGAEIAMQWVEWPYRNSSSDTFDIHGFQVALSIAKWSLSNLK